MGNCDSSGSPQSSCGCGRRMAGRAGAGLEHPGVARQKKLQLQAYEELSKALSLDEGAPELADKVNSNISRVSVLF